MLADLATRLEELPCTYGHNCTIRYVQTARKASRRFLCDDCLHMTEDQYNKDKILDLKDYIKGLRNLATNQETQARTTQAFQTETESGLEVTEILTRDLADSLGGIKSMVQNHYTDLVTKVTRNSTKCSTLVIPVIEKDLKRHLFQLGSIEKNLLVMKDGGNPADVCQILDQAIDYTTKKRVADNGLYNLLTGLNPLDAAQGTHLRLSTFSNRYLSRKRHLIKAIRSTLETRFKKDERMLQEFVEQRKKILSSIDTYLAGTPKDEEKTGTSADQQRRTHHTERSAMRQALSRLGATKQSNSGRYLGKRRPLTPEYDPIASFEKKFGTKNALSFEEQMNNLKVEGAQPTKSRLSDALKSKKPTQPSRFYGSNGNPNSNSNQARFKSKRSYDQNRSSGAIEVEQFTEDNNHGLSNAVSKVLQPRLTNVITSITGHPYTKNTVLEDTLKTMSSRRTAQSYLDFLAKEKKKQGTNSRLETSFRGSENQKENQRAPTSVDIHEHSQQLQRVMLEVPIKKLNLNDPRHKSMAQSALAASRSHNN
jgi:hypothetical protein